MFKSIHGIAPTYLSDRVVMNFDVNGYDTRTSDMELYLPTLRKEAYRNSFMYMGGKLWNDLPEFVQNSANIESFTTMRLITTMRQFSGAGLTIKQEPKDMVTPDKQPMLMWRKVQPNYQRQLWTFVKTVEKAIMLQMIADIGHQ